jgi:hypothetical protein
MTLITILLFLIALPIIISLVVLFGGALIAVPNIIYTKLTGKKLYEKQ